MRCGNDSSFWDKSILVTCGVTYRLMILDSWCGRLQMERSSLVLFSFFFLKVLMNVLLRSSLGNTSMTRHFSSNSSVRRRHSRSSYVLYSYSFMTDWCSDSRDNRKYEACVDLPRGLPMMCLLRRVSTVSSSSLIDYARVRSSSWSREYFYCMIFEQPLIILSMFRPKNPPPAPAAPEPSK